MILISGSWGRISGRKTSVAGHAPTTCHFYDKPKEKDVHVLLYQGTFIKMNNQNSWNSLIIIEEICCRLLPQQNSNLRNEIGVLTYQRKFNKRPLFSFLFISFSGRKSCQKSRRLWNSTKYCIKTQPYRLLNQNPIKIMP